MSHLALGRAAGAGVVTQDLVRGGFKLAIGVAVRQNVGCVVDILGRYRLSLEIAASAL